MRADTQTQAIMKSPVSKKNDPPERDAACGWEAVTEFVDWDQTLPVATMLRDYEVRSVIAESACAVVYLAWDHALRRRIAIKEYLPRALASRSRTAPAVQCKGAAAEAAYAAGLKAFVAEARMLARFDHAALVKVYRFWEENGTAYMAMPLLEGPRLDQALVAGPQDETAVRAWLRPILDALAMMHAGRCFHHHIGPDSIVLTASGPVLLGFSAASRLLASARDDPTAGIKPGYAPIEQYSDAAVLAPGPWTDLYALAAVVYRAIGGQEPTPAPERASVDAMQLLARLAPERGSAVFLQAIDATLALHAEHRPRDDTEFRELVGAMDAPLPTLPLGQAHDLMAEPFGKRDDAPREITVPLTTQPAPASEGEATPVALVPAPPPGPGAHVQPAAGPRGTSSAKPLPRKLVLAIVAGVGVLGALAAATLFFYAAPGPLATTPSGASAIPEATAPPAVAATPAATAIPTATPTDSPSPAPSSTSPPTPTLARTPTLAATNAAAVPTPATPTAAALTPSALPPGTPTTPRVSAALPTVDARPVTAPTPPTAPTRTVDRKTRCAELLQEATLRRLTAGEIELLRKDCR